MRPLDGKRVVVTRPRGRAAELTRELRALGAQVVSLPLIRIRSRQPALEAALASHDWVALTSLHGVQAVVPKLARMGRGRPRVAAVGPGTARALLRRGIRPDVVARTATAEGLARALRQALAGARARVLHPTSDRARRALREGLTSGGHRVTELVAYRTLATKPPSAGLRRRAAQADAIVVCSPSAVRQLRARQLASPRALLACIGPVTARAAREQGFRVGAVASRPTPRALAAAVARALGAEP